MMVLEVLYHKHNPHITKTESETNSNKMILILVQNVHKKKKR